MTRLTRKERWTRAKELQDFYNSTYNTNYSKRDFYADDNPLTRKLVRYDITYSMNMHGNNRKLGGSYEFYIPQDTITVYSLSDVETENHLIETTKGQIADIFRGKSKNQVYNNTDVNIVRGIEKGKVKYEDVNVNEIERDINSSSVSKKIDVYSKRNGSINKNSYEINIWTKNNN